LYHVGNYLKSPKPGGSGDPLLFAKVKIYLKMSGSPYDDGRPPSSLPPGFGKVSF
jgi:hypothetical protein